MSPARYFAFENEPGDNPWLDLVRAIAITLVFVRHGHRAFTSVHDGSAGFLDALLLNGWVGVDLFFVLSGYLISRHLIRDGLGTGRFVLRRYLVGRALRIVPAYVAVLLLVVAGAFPFFAFPGENLGWRIAYHLVFLQDYLPSDFNIVFWSLGVEEKFYLLAPALLWLLMTRRTLAGAALILLLLAGFSPSARALLFMGYDAPPDYETFFRAFRSPFHQSLEPLMIGVGIAVAESSTRIRMSPASASTLFAVSLGALALWLGSHEFMREIGWFDAVAQPTLIAVFCGVTTFAAAGMRHVPMRGALPVRIAARLSYSLYLVHYPLIPLALSAALASQHPLAAFWITYLTVVTIAACLLHFGVEKPFLVLKKRLAGKAAPDRGQRESWKGLREQPS